MSGRRYGAARSPGGAAPARSAWRGRSARSVSVRAILLYLLPTPLLLGALLSLMMGEPARMAAQVGAWGLLIAGASLTRAGVAAAAAYAARAVARPPAFPRKLFGAALTGAGVALASWLTGAGGGAAVAGLFAAALHVAAFGPDPMTSKGLDGLSGEALDAAVTRIETARRLIAEMTAAAASFDDAALAGRVRAVAASAEAVVAQLERAPEGLARARRFLAVYLVGARDAAVKYAQAFEETRDPAVTARLGALMDDLSAQFDRHRAALAEGDRVALDVEMDVLQTRLKVEGL